MAGHVVRGIQTAFTGHTSFRQAVHWLRGLLSRVSQRGELSAIIHPHLVGLMNSLSPLQPGSMKEKVIEDLSTWLLRRA